MYAAFDGKQIVAFHDEYRVVEEYCSLIEKNHNGRLSICKIKDKKCTKLDYFEDLYLVRYNETYVQSGYVLYLQILTDDYIHDHVYAKDILMRILEFYSFSKDEMKAIKKTIKILDNMIKDDSEYVPELSTLKSMEVDYQPYIYNKGIFNITNVSNEEELFNEKSSK